MYVYLYYDPLLFYPSASTRKRDKHALKQKYYITAFKFDLLLILFTQIRNSLTPHNSDLKNYSTHLRWLVNSNDSF